MPKVDKESNIYHFGVRWSVEHNREHKEAMHQWLKQVADKYVFQAEFTEDAETKKPNPHYQGYFHTVKKNRPTTMAIAANPILRGVNVQASSTAGITSLKGYCMKMESRVAGPWADKKIYMGADLWAFERMPPWQREMLDKLAMPPGDRKMFWIYDPTGNSGKTKFAKTLCFRHDAVGLGYGNSTDVLNLVSKFVGKRIYCWNLTRAKPANLSELDLYSAMESVKDGFFINLKYETAQVLMDPPHVLVMANHVPKYAHISADRWDVLLLKDGKLTPIKPV